jgi:hypothetical protein
MVSEPLNWTVPAPLRALLWWPPLAFVLVLLEPTAAATTIAATGAALAVLGVVGTSVGQAISRRRARRRGDEPASTTLTVAASVDRAVSLPAEQQAA